VTPWTGSAELRERARREWERGLLPCALVGGPAVFPLRIRLKAPSSSELAERFDEARAWIADLSAGEGRGGYRLEWRELNHRQLGQNRIPEAAVFDSAQDLIALAGKRREGERLVALARAIAAAFPALEPWLARRAPVVLEKAEDWVGRRS